MIKHDSVLAALGRNVRRAREKNELTQEKLAEIAELDPTYISGIERGLRNPDIKNVAKITKALGITTSELYKGVVAWVRRKASKQLRRRKRSRWLATISGRLHHDGSEGNRHPARSTCLAYELAVRRKEQNSVPAMVVEKSSAVACSESRSVCRRA